MRDDRGRSIQDVVQPARWVGDVHASGAVDPGVALLLRHGGSAEKLEKMLDKQSGLKGLSGLNGDTRVLVPAAGRGDDRARLALDVFIHRLRAGIGQMLASLGDMPHALVFTDAISEGEPSIRESACAAFAFLGLQLDPQKNAASSFDTDFATKDSRVRALLIKSREAWQIARECHAHHGLTTTRMNASILYLATSDGSIIVRSGDRWRAECPLDLRATADDDNIHASIARDPRRPERVFYGLPEQGIWRSNDSGVTWQEVFRGLPQNRVTAQAISAAGTSMSVPSPAGCSFPKTVVKPGSSAKEWKNCLRQSNGVLRRGRIAITRAGFSPIRARRKSCSWRSRRAR